MSTAMKLVDAAQASRDSAERLGSADAYVSRVLSLVGVHAHALHALLTVSRVAWSDQIETACVECTAGPRLLLNPQFVEAWCHTPERLATLMMHELLHIALGHTRLYPHHTPVHNIAFDAIINRTVLATLEGAEVELAPYANLFTEFYSARSAPCFLLRPPPGWPQKPNWNASEGLAPVLRCIHQKLYRYESDGIARPFTHVTYSDIVEALRESGSVPGESDGGVSLLGAHGTTGAERQWLSGTRDADAAAELARVFDPLRGAMPGAGADLGLTDVRDVSRSPSLERALRSLLRRAVQRDTAARARWVWHERPIRVVHRLSDRRAACRAHAARLLGAPAPLMFDGALTERRPEPTHLTIYLDVSGSMHDLLPHLRRALLSLRKEVRPSLFWFSTEVVEQRPGELETGRMPTTGGTEVGTVLDHAVRTLGPGGAALVLTDGWLERVPRRRSARLRAAGIALHLGVLGNGPLWDAAPWVATSTRLSGLER